MVQQAVAFWMKGDRVKRCVASPKIKNDFTPWKLMSIYWRLAVFETFLCKLAKKQHPKSVARPVGCLESVEFTLYSNLNSAYHDKFVPVPRIKRLFFPSDLITKYPISFRKLTNRIDDLSS
jgi:hypothetical protein